MDILLSSLYISQAIAAISVAMFALCACQKVKFGTLNRVCLVVAIWLSLEILSDYISTSFQLETSAIESARYYLILASASLIMMAITHLNGIYPKSIRIMFTLITFICVSMAFYRWGAQSRWSEGGAEFFNSYGTLLDSAFVYSIVAMDALMILLGVYSALVTSSNTTNSIRGERR